MEPKKPQAPTPGRVVRFHGPAGAETATVAGVHPDGMTTNLSVLDFEARTRREMAVPFGGELGDGSRWWSWPVRTDAKKEPGLVDRVLGRGPTEGDAEH